MGLGTSSLCFGWDKISSGATDLHEAAFKLDLTAVKQLLEDGERVDATSDTGATVLHFAAANVLHGREIIKFLLAEKLAGVTVDQKTRNGEEAIHYAVRVGNQGVVKDLLNLRGADFELLQFCIKQNQPRIAKMVHKCDSSLLEKLDREGRSVLHLAAQYSSLDTCQWLIEEDLGVDALCAPLGDSVLHFAARNLRHGWEIIRYLNYFVPSELDVDERNKKLETPLHAALKCNNVRAAEELVRLGSDLEIGHRGDDLLAFSVRHNVLDSAKLVLRASWGRQTGDTLTDSTWTVVECKQQVPRKDTLFVAAQNADLDTCKWLIEEVRLDPEELNADDRRRSVLHYAALNKNYGKNLVRYFVKGHKLDVNLKDGENKTPLNVALEKGNIECVQVLFRVGAKLLLEAYDENYLHFCVRWNKLKSAKCVHLLKPGLIRQRINRSLSILHVAAMHADLDMFQWLVSQHASDQNEETSDTAMHFAARNKKHGAAIALYLVSLARDVNAKNKFLETPLYLALLNENLEAAEEMARSGADLSVQIRNESLLISCVRLKKLRSAEFLLERGAALVNQRGSKGETALHFAAERSDVDTCHWLVGVGADFRAVDAHGSSVLHFAAGNKAKQGRSLVCYFSSLDLDLNATNDAMETPLHVALAKGNEDVVQELCRLGADLSVRINGEGLLHLCASLGRLRSAVVLLDKDPTLLAAVNNAGRTPLHVAAKWGNVQFYHWLIHQGIETEVAAKDGKKARDLIPRAR